MSITTTGTRPNVGADARSRLLAELAASPARKGYGIAYDLLGNRAEAEEAVQDALARACESIGDLRDPAAAPAWFLRIVTTQCLRTLRRRRLRRRLFGWLPAKDAETFDATPLDNGKHEDIAERMHGSGGPAPREALVDQEELGALLGRLSDLSPQQRTALVLRYGHDLPVAEVAALLGVELANHVKACSRCQRLVDMPRKLAALGRARHASDPGLGFSARMTVAAQQRIAVRHRRRIAGGLAATVAAGVLGVFVMTRSGSQEDTRRPAYEAPVAEPSQPVAVDAKDVQMLVDLADTRRARRVSAPWGRIQRPLKPYIQLVKGVAQ